MRMVWVAATVLILLILFGFGSAYYTTCLYQDLTESLMEIEQMAQKERWDKARQAANALRETWSRADAFWTATMDHREVGHLDESMSRVFRWVELKAREDLLVETAVARRQLTRLKDKEIPGLRNIF